MSRPESKRPGRPETGVLQTDLPVEEALRHMFAYGWPRERRKATVSKSGEEVQSTHQDEARRVGTYRHRPRWTRP